MNDRTLSPKRNLGPRRTARWQRRKGRGGEVKVVGDAERADGNRRKRQAQTISSPIERMAEQDHPESETSVRYRIRPHSYSTTEHRGSDDSHRPTDMEEVHGIDRREGMTSGRHAWAGQPGNGRSPQSPNHDTETRRSARMYRSNSSVEKNAEL